MDTIGYIDMCAYMYVHPYTRICTCQNNYRRYEFGMEDNKKSWRGRGRRESDLDAVLMYVQFLCMCSVHVCAVLMCEVLKKLLKKITSNITQTRTHMCVY